LCPLVVSLADRLHNSREIYQPAGTSAPSRRLIRTNFVFTDFMGLIMNATHRSSIFLLVAIVSIGPSRLPLAEAQASPERAPRVFVLDARQLQVNKQRIRDGDKSIAPALERLERDAQKARVAGPFSVVDKQATPPSGDKHDYMSQAPYFWPDPKSPNGLPYIRRDGERNPEINKFPDHSNMDKMIGAVETLALAFYFKGDEANADKAARLLRAWFLDTKTRMNPSLQFAQATPGRDTGRGIGLIETRGLVRVIDAVGLLAGSRAWSNDDQRSLEDWFGKFLQWMLDSKNGRDERAAKNNHGTYYDAQVSSFALFVGKADLARQILGDAREKRIAVQIEPDGRQPLELARTKAWSYSVMNLDGLVLLARLGENVGVDLWNYRTSDGRSIRRALDYLVPYALGAKKWPDQQIGEWQPEILFPSLRRAADKYHDETYRSVLSRLPAVDASERGNLVLRGPDKNPQH
jgi:alginate lyase